MSRCSGPNDRKKNLVVRLHGSGKQKPVLLIGHLDVVEARREDWTTDPFQFVEKDGYYYGRGTQDMKADDAILVTTLIRFKKEDYVPDRDLILALTADEEGGKSNGVDWLHQEPSRVDRCGVRAEPRQRRRQYRSGQAADGHHGCDRKALCRLPAQTTNPGGHSSLPVPDNAIYHLTEAWSGCSTISFPSS